jgi:outer membrane beta-barrel protein
MESRFRVLLLIASPVLLGGCAIWPFHRKAPPTPAVVSAPQSETDHAPVVEPQVARQEIRIPKIRNSNVEVGVSAGVFNVEQFGTYPGVAGRLVYHIKENLFAEASAGISKLRDSNYVDATGHLRTLTSSQRKLLDYSLDLGYDILPGEVYLGKTHSYNSALYLVAGVGGMHYGGESFFSGNAGAGYRLLLNERVTMHVELRDAITQKSLTGAKRLSNNLEGTLGVSVFF